MQEGGHGSTCGSPCYSTAPSEPALVAALLTWQSVRESSKPGSSSAVPRPGCQAGFSAQPGCSSTSIYFSAAARRVTEAEAHAIAGSVDPYTINSHAQSQASWEDSAPHSPFSSPPTPQLRATGKHFCPGRQREEEGTLGEWESRDYFL